MRRQSSQDTKLNRISFSIMNSEITNKLAADILDDALDLATKGHSGQKRKKMDEDYIEHPKRVVEILKRWGVDDHVELAAAFGHDLLEDTNISPSEVSSKLGSEVLELISELSKKQGTDKRQYMANLAKNGSARAIVIKAADRISNTEDFVRGGDRKYAAKYLGYAEAIFDRLHSLSGQIDPGVIRNAMNDYKRLVSRLAVASEMKTAFEFSTQDALNQYLKTHPDADKSLHRVKKKEERIKQEEEPKQKEQKAPEEKPEEKKAPKEEEKEKKTPKDDEQKSGAKPEDFFSDTSNLMHVDKLVPTEFVGKEIDEKKVEKAKKVMSDPDAKKRGPITVRENKEGKYEIVDGNTTYWLAKEKGLENFPVKIDNNAKTLSEMKDEAKASGISEEEMGQKDERGKIKGESKKWLQKAIAERQKNKPEQKTPEKKEFDYFSEEETAKLPKKSKQKQNTEEELYKSASEAQEHMMDWLDRGKGMDKTLGAAHHNPNSPEDFNNVVVDKNFDKPGPVIITAPLKGKERATEKVNGDYKGDWSKLTDAVRATIAVDSIDDVDDVVDKLKKSGMKLSAKPKNRFKEPSAGYRDMLLTVEYPNGHVGELQIHTKPILKAKETQGHKIYEKVRNIDTAAKKENRATFTPEEEQTIAEAEDAMKKVYDAAWEKSRVKKAYAKEEAKRMINVKRETYYDYDGLPAYVKPHQRPVVLVTKSKHSVVYDIFKFNHGATEITLNEFDKMVLELED